jgi:hypothetical protein
MNNNERGNDKEAWGVGGRFRSDQRSCYRCRERASPDVGVTRFGRAF